jgi:hypothetical protein
MSESESESQLLYDRQFTADQFVLAPSPLRLTTSNFIFQLNTSSYSPYVISSLTRGWVCRLQLLLLLASAVSLRPEFRGAHDDFYCLRFETPPTWRDRSPYLYPPGTGWPSYTPGTGFPFRRILRLAGLRWRYSIQPPHGNSLRHGGEHRVIHGTQYSRPKSASCTICDF